MNEWYTLVNGLETDVPALDEVTTTRVKKRVHAALPRRWKRRWLAAAVAAVLVLTACGYAAVTGQFSQWFWNKAEDPHSPESSEDLLASMGTVIGQSQTINGVTVTLNGALWDGWTLMLSLNVEGFKISKNAQFQVETEDSWLFSSKAQMEKIWREYYPDKTEAEREANIDHHREYLSSIYCPDITCFCDRQTQTCYLQAQCTYLNPPNIAELELHLENLTLRDTTLEGPFDFTFAVEEKPVELTYKGTVTMDPVEDLTPIQINKVVLSPLRAQVFYAGTEPLLPYPENTSKLGASAPTLTALRINGREELLNTSACSFSGSLQADGSWNGCAYCAPLYRVIDPATVEAIRLEDTWLELSELTLIGSPSRLYAKNSSG